MGDIEDKMRERRQRTERGRLVAHTAEKLVEEAAEQVAREVNLRLLVEAIPATISLIKQLKYPEDLPWGIYDPNDGGQLLYWHLYSDSSREHHDDDGRRPSYRDEYGVYVLCRDGRIAYIDNKWRKKVDGVELANRMVVYTTSGTPVWTYQSNFQMRGSRIDVWQKPNDYDPTSNWNAQEPLVELLYDGVIRLRDAIVCDGV